MEAVTSKTADALSSIWYMEELEVPLPKKIVKKRRKAKSDSKGDEKEEEDSKGNTTLSGEDINMAVTLGSRNEDQDIELDELQNTYREDKEEGEGEGGVNTLVGGEDPSDNKKMEGDGDIEQSESEDGGHGNNDEKNSENNEPTTGEKDSQEDNENGGQNGHQADQQNDQEDDSEEYEEYSEMEGRLLKKRALAIIVIGIVFTPPTHVS